MRFRSIRRRAFPRELGPKVHILRSRDEPEEPETDETDDESEETPSPTRTGFPASRTTPTAVVTTTSIPPSPAPPANIVTLTPLPPEAVRSSASASATSNPANIRTLTPIPPKPILASTSASSSATDAPTNTRTLAPTPPESLRTSVSASAAQSSTIGATKSTISSAGTLFPLASPSGTSLAEIGTTTAASPAQTGKGQINSTERLDDNDLPPSDGVHPRHRISKVAIGLGSIAGIVLIACIIFAIYTLHKRRKRSNNGHISQIGDNYRAAARGSKPWKSWFAPRTSRSPSVKPDSKIFADMFAAAHAAEQGDGRYYPGSQGQVGPNDFVDEKNNALTYIHHETTGTSHGLDPNQHLQPIPTVQPSEPIQRRVSAQADMTRGDFLSQPPPVLTCVTNNSTLSPSPAASTPYAQTIADAELLSLYARSSRGPSWYYKLPHQARQELEGAEQRYAERRERHLAQLEAETAQMEREISLQQAQSNGIMLGVGAAVLGGKAATSGPDRKHGE